MSMKRRDKQDMNLMDTFVRGYLLVAGNDAHKAYNNMIKEHLMSSQSIPYYVKGIKDFIKVSQDIKKELESYKIAKEGYGWKVQDKLDKLKEITQEEYKNRILPIFREVENQNKKMTLVDLWQCIISGEYKLTANDFRNLEELGII